MSQRKRDNANTVSRLVIEPSPELKALTRKFVEIQRAKHGPDWKEKLSAEMAAITAPVFTALQNMMRKDKPNGEA